MIERALLLLMGLLSCCALSQEQNYEPIPNSPLHLSFPKSWSYFKPYAGGEIGYRSLNISPQYSMYPELRSAFLKDGDSEKWPDKALVKDLPVIRLNDKRARVYSSDKNYRRCGVELSAESSVGIYKSTAYIVQMEDGHLICELTTREEQVVERRKYTQHLQDLCTQAIKSGGNIQYQ